MNFIKTLSLVILAFFAANCTTTTEQLVPPRIVSEVKAVYPEYLYNKGIGGKAIIEVVLDKEGRVMSTKVVQTTHSLFAETAIDAVKQSIFEPASEGGVAVASKIRVPITFNPPSMKRVNPDFRKELPAEQDAAANSSE